MLTTVYMIDGNTVIGIGKDKGYYSGYGIDVLMSSFASPQNGYSICNFRLTLEQVRQALEPIRKAAPNMRLWFYTNCGRQDNYSPRQKAHKRDSRTLGYWDSETEFEQIQESLSNVGQVCGELGFERFMFEYELYGGAFPSQPPDIAYPTATQTQINKWGSMLANAPRANNKNLALGGFVNYAMEAPTPSWLKLMKAFNKAATLLDTRGRPVNDPVKQPLIMLEETYYPPNFTKAKLNNYFDKVHNQTGFNQVAGMWASNADDWRNWDDWFKPQIPYLQNMVKRCPYLGIWNPRQMWNTPTMLGDGKPEHLAAIGKVLTALHS